MYSWNKKYALSAAGMVFALSPVASAIAQTEEKKADDNKYEQVVVKARKRDETIIEVPLSVKAFTSKDLQESGLTELESLANFTPNLDFQNVGNSQPGRFNPGIRFRGMDIAISTPTNQTGGFFVDGVAVLGGESSVSFSDIAQVEVLRGPQPVYFGRGTFGGAINYTTVTPGDEFSGQISGGFSPTFGSNEFNAYVEGALSENVSSRLTVFNREQGAPFTATDGGELGAEKTTGVSLILAMTPTENLSVKSRIAYSQDDDGAPASTFVKYSENNNISVGDTFSAQTNNGTVEATWATPWLSGSLPYTTVSSNTRFYDVTVAGQTQYGDALEDGAYSMNELLAMRPEGGDTPSLDHIGLRSDMLVFSTEASYFIDENFSFDGLAGYSHKSTTQIRDADQTDAQAWIVQTYLELESWSAEGRLNYDNNDNFRAMAGVNYSVIDQMGDVDGGWNVFNGYYGGMLFGFGTSYLDATKIETLGIFGSAEYDFTDWATLVVEARYQDDTTDNRSGFTEGTLSPSAELSFDGILPRISLLLSPMDDANVFLTYSEAMLPGAYNSMFDSMDADDAAEFLAANPNIETETEEETIKSYELGWKQSVLDGALWYSLVGFHQQWEGMKSTGLYTFTGTSTGTSYFLTPTMTGSSTQTGIELEGRWSASDNLNIQFAYGYTSSEYDSYNSNSFRSALGLPYGTFYKADGNTLPRSPAHSGAVGITWQDGLNAEWDYALRADTTFRSKTYTDELNLTTIEGYTLLNLRAKLIGTDNGVSVELYCNNCTDKEGWATGRRLTDFSAMPNFFATQGAVVDPIMPREVGIRASYEF